ncbi:hypothetical protein Hanom_Chr11g01036491 [Helianthus anomalus]
MTLAQFAVHCDLYLQDEIETDVYMSGLAVVDRPTLSWFWRVVAATDTWE